MGRYNKVRTDLIDKLGGKCVGCGASDTEARLDFDHIDPTTKSFDVTAYITRNAVQAEIEALSKCQLLCRKCHCAKTFSSDAFKLSATERTGEGNRMSKLTDPQRLFVIAQVAAGRSQRSLARELGVTHQSIGDILKSPYWLKQYDTHVLALDSSRSNHTK